VSEKLKARRKNLEDFLDDFVTKFFRKKGCESVKLSLFGSIAAHIDTPTSDVDLLLKVEGKMPDNWLLSPDKRKGMWGRKEPSALDAKAGEDSKGEGERTKEVLSEEEGEEEGADGGAGEDGEGETAGGDDESGLDKKTILLELSKALRHSRERKVDPWAVIQTRVPLIKITDHKTGLCCDISMENDLSLYKSALLRSYVAIDDRFPKLLALVKTWAQARNINDAAQHSLNSFGYTLLVIQFLQISSPPVLPCLQAETLQHNGRTLQLPPAIGSVGNLEIRYHGCQGATWDDVSGDVCLRMLTYVC